MTDLAPEDIQHIAHIARLALSAGEPERFATEAREILAHFESVMAGSGEAAREHSLASLPPRPDDAVQSDPSQAEAIVAQFPRRDGRICKVPGGL